MPLLTPDILVCSVGTEILINGKPDAEWEAYLDGGGWDREQAAAVAGRFPELVLQRSSEQRPHKVSYKLYAKDPEQATGVISNLRAQLSSAGLETTVIFSGGEDVDILPDRASKGRALAFLLHQIEEARGNRPPAGVLVAGDSGNDIELFSVPGVLGCVVANAHKELLEWCDAKDGENNTSEDTSENGGSETQGRSAPKDQDSASQSETRSSIDQQGRIFRATLDGPGGIREALYHFDLVRSTSQVPSMGRDVKDGPDAEGIAQEENKELYRGNVARREAVVHLHTAFERYFNAMGSTEEDKIAVFEEIAGFLEDGFEMVSPSGGMCSRSDLLTWLEDRGWGSRVARANTGGGSLLSAELSEDRVYSGPVGNLDTQSGVAFRIWVDQYQEREMAPGVFLVTYRELQQRFASSDDGEDEKSHGAEKKDAALGSRTVRRSSAILRKSKDGSDAHQQLRYKWAHVHETWEQSEQ